MIYRSYTDLSNLIRENLWKIPHDIDLVVGIPRSGMIPASMVALYFNIKFTDIDSFIDGRLLSIGTSRADLMKERDIKKVLVVDDSVGHGNSMKKAKERLAPLTSQYEFLYFSPIVTEFCTDVVDIYGETTGTDRIFEWNLFHHRFIESACVDIDGVLNVDPEIDDDGPVYSNYIANATPLFLPTATIDTLITCRLEKYREITEKWLKDHNISYNHLVMLDLPDKEARVEWNKHGEWKGEFYKKNNHILFIESSLSQAEKIARIAQKDVYCVETNTMITPEFELKQAIGNKYVMKKTIKNKFPRLYNIYSRVLRILK